MVWIEIIDEEINKLSNEVAEKSDNVVKQSA